MKPERRTLFVSGGSRGIGKALVVEASRQGWNVAFTYARDEVAAASVVALVRDVAPQAVVKHFRLDVRDSEAVDAVAAAVTTELGGIDAVVANAGVSINGLAYSVTDEDWDEVLSTNLSGAFYVCRAFLPDLVAKRSGRILLVSSVTAEGASGQVAYAASKGGLIGLGKALAKEYGPKGVTTNIVVPGYFETDMTRETMSSNLSEFAIQYCPLRRLGGLEELAHTMCFLLSNGAGFINGAEIRVTGGLDWAP